MTEPLPQQQPTQQSLIEPDKPKKKFRKWLGIAAAAIVVIAVGSAINEKKDTDSSRASDTSASQSSDAGSESADASQPTQAAPESTKAVTKAAPEPTQAEPEMAAGQKNALKAAENYLSFTAFSRAGLIQQLSSDAGDGYSVEDATFAADNMKVDWNEQAAKAAKNYLDMMPFSRQGLIEQLSSPAGDGYTLEQATYGVDQAGL